MEPSYYRFPDQDTWEQLADQIALRRPAVDANGEPIEGEWIYEAGRGGSIVVVGRTMAARAEFNPKTGTVTPPVFHDGWHVNILMEDPPEILDDYLVCSASPDLSYAGLGEVVPGPAVLEDMVRGVGKDDGGPYRRAMARRSGAGRRELIEQAEAVALKASDDGRVRVAPDVRALLEERRAEIESRINAARGGRR